MLKLYMSTLIFLNNEFVKLVCLKRTVGDWLKRKLIVSCVFADGSLVLIDCYSVPGKITVGTRST